MLGRVVRPPRAAESTGLQNGHFRLKKLLFCAQQNLNYWDNKRKFDKRDFFCLFVKVRNFCPGWPIVIARPGRKKKRSYATDPSVLN